MRQPKAILIFASSLTVMSGAALAPALPAIEEALGAQATAPWVKLLLTLPSLFVAVIAPFSGLIADRLDRRRLLTAAAILYLVAGTAGLYLENLWLLLASRALLGMAVAFTMTATTSLIGDYLQGPARQRFLGTQAGAMAGGGVLFLLVSGLLAEWNWRAPFLIYALALGVIAGSLRLPKPPAGKARPGPAPNGVQDGPETPQVRSRRSNGVPLLPLAEPLFAAFFTMLAFYTIPVHLPYLLSARGLGSSGAAGGIMAISNLTMGLTAVLFFSRLQERFGNLLLTGSGFLSAAGGFILVAGAGSLPEVALGMVLAGLAGGLTMPTASVWILREAPARLRGQASGWLTAAVFLGQFLSPLVSQPAFVRGAYGTGYLATATAAAAVAAFFLLNGLRRSKRSASP